MDEHSLVSLAARLSSIVNLSLQKQIFFTISHLILFLNLSPH